MDKGVKMNEIKKTTLHPDSQPNIDLYPKTSADQVDGLQEFVEQYSSDSIKVPINVPKGATNGNITDEQLAILQKSDLNYIEMVNDKELYYLNDSGHEDGYLTYLHVGIENSKITIKTLTVTVSAKSFVIVTTAATTAVSTNVYLHSIDFDPDSSTVTVYYLYFYSTFNTSITYDNINEYMNQIPFGVLCHIDNNGAFLFDGIITMIQQGSPGKIVLGQPGAGLKRMLKLNSDTVTEV